MPYNAPEGYSKVYEGGHHAVYCNGAEHIRTHGGYTQTISPEIEQKRRTRCDCAFWNTLRDRMAESA